MAVSFGWHSHVLQHLTKNLTQPAGDVSRLLLDPTGFHALLTNSSGETWYLNFQSHLAEWCSFVPSFVPCEDPGTVPLCCTLIGQGNQAKALPKLKGHVLEAAAWDQEATTTSTRDLLLGARACSAREFMRRYRGVCCSAHESKSLPRAFSYKCYQAMVSPSFWSNAIVDSIHLSPCQAHELPRSCTSLSRARSKHVSVIRFKLCTLAKPLEERTVKTVFEFDRPAPVVGVHCDSWNQHNYRMYTYIHMYIYILFISVYVYIYIHICAHAANAKVWNLYRGHVLLAAFKFHFLACF